MKTRLLFLALFATLALAPIVAHADSGATACPAGHYGESCADLSAYQPLWDYDVTYWADQARAGTLDTQMFTRATLLWEWRSMDAAAWHAPLIVQVFWTVVLHVEAPECAPVGGNAYRAARGLQLDGLSNVLIGDNVVPYDALCQ